MSRKVTKSITADDTFTDELQIYAGDNFNVSISGTWVATVTVQRIFEDRETWVDVESFTANTEKTGFESESGVRYRIGVKSGNFTSGTAEVRISQ